MDYEMIDLLIDLPNGIEFNDETDFGIKILKDFEFIGQFHSSSKGRVYDKSVLTLFLLFKLWIKGGKERFYIIPYFLGTTSGQSGWIKQNDWWVSFYEKNKNLRDEYRDIFMEIVNKVYFPTS